MKRICWFLFLYSELLYSQSSQDVNWVFGQNVHLKFNPNIVIDSLSVSDFEAAATISDSLGNLLFYIDGDYNGKLWIRDAQGNLITNSDIACNPSFARGIIFLPTNDIDMYVCIYTGLTNNLSCDNSWCLYLYYSFLERHNGNWTISKKDILLYDKDVKEGIAAVRNAGSNAWWLVARSDYRTNACAQDFVVIGVTDTIFSLPQKKLIGIEDCRDTYPSGEIRFSKDGKKLAMVNYLNHSVELFDFDRCTGDISNHVIVDTSKFVAPYSCEFSPNGEILYVVSDSGSLSFSQNHYGRLFQYSKIAPTGLFLKYEVWNDTANVLSPGQLALAPDGLIYMAYGSISSNVTQNYFTSRLSRIKQPNSLFNSCLFTPFDLPLKENTYSMLSLPNMPNYNLGPTTIYQANAGVDTFYCANDTNATKGPPIGAAPVPGVTYEWRPGPDIDSINASRQYVKPPISQWYYLTITDTSIQGSCQSRTDSVYVEVRVCTGLDEPAPKHHDYRLLPNLFKDDRSARVTLGGGESGRADIYAMDGRLVGSYRLTAGTNNLELPQNMGTGVFVYKIWVADTIKTNGKLVIVK